MTPPVVDAIAVTPEQARELRHKSEAVTRAIEAGEVAAAHTKIAIAAARTEARDALRRIVEAGGGDPTIAWVLDGSMLRHDVR